MLILKRFMLCFAMLLCLTAFKGFSAYAAPYYEVAPRYAHTNDIYATLSIVGSSARCYGYVDPLSTTSSAKIVVKLQRKVNGAWCTIKTWSGSASGGRRAEASGNHTITAGYSYRVMAVGTIMAANGTVLEEVTATSATRFYPLGGGCRVVEALTPAH